MCFTEEEMQEYDEQLDSLEPEPENLKTYEEFFKEKYKESDSEKKRAGTDKEFEICKRYKSINQQIADLTKDKQQAKNDILYFMKNYEEVDFGKYGRVVNRFSEGKRGYFGCNVKNYE